MIRTHFWIVLIEGFLVGGGGGGEGRGGEMERGD